MSYRETLLTHLKPEAKRELIERKLKAHGGNVTAAAADLRIHRVWLHRVMQQLKLNAVDFRPPP